MRRLLVLAVGIGVLGIFGSPHANAHASFSSSSPAPSESLESAPQAVSVTFTEEPDPAVSRIEVFDTEGASFHRGRPEPATQDPRTQHVALEPLPDGVYTVSWRVVSRVDGHLTSGTFAFGVGVSPDEIEVADVPEEETAGASPSEVAGRFGLYAGLVVLVGASWLYTLAFATPPRRGRHLVASAVAVSVAGTVLLGTAQLRSADVGLGVFLSTSMGNLVIWRLAALGVAAVALLFLARRWSWWVLGLAAAGAVVAHVSGGHAASGATASFEVATQSVHMGAVGVWIGGLAALLVGLSAIAGEERGRVVRRFSAVASVALAAVAATGLVRAWNELAAWGDLTGTTYGRVVVAKVGLLGVLALLGLRNRTRSVRRVVEDATPLRRVSGAELAVAAGVLVLTGLLAATPPARGDRTDVEPVAVEGTDLARSVEVRMEISPGLPGANAFDVWVEVLRGAEVEGVRLRLSPLDSPISAATLTLEGDRGRWTTRAAALSAAGRWQATVVVDRGAETVEVPLFFHTSCRPGRTQQVGDLRIHDIDLGAGRTVQTYVDPGRSGGNEVHFTFFDSEGHEMEMADGPAVRALRDGEEMELEVRRAGRGHFLAGGELDGGRWLLSFAGETEGGDRLNTCFIEEVN